MKERLGVRCERLERDLAAAERELEQYRGGIEVARLKWQRDVLARFAVQCALWGTEPCRCSGRADDALRKAGILDADRQRIEEAL